MGPVSGGLLVVDKPVGPTSHDVVAQVRRLLDEPRVGHTGTLDPNASGVLPLVIGRATRLARFLSGADKSYDAVVRLGFATTTYDSEGEPVGAPHAGAFPDRQAIERALEAFRGMFLQRPPAFSAKKIAGRRSYRLARAAASSAAAGRALEPPPSPPGAQVDDGVGGDAPGRGGTVAPSERRSAPAAPAATPVTVYLLEVADVAGDLVTLRVTCSSGFYVRSLAHDLGERLGIGAHLHALRRTRSGDYTLAEAIALSTIEAPGGRAAAQEALVPLARMLPALPSGTLTSDGVRRALHGRDLGPTDFSGTPPNQSSPAGPVRLLAPSGDLVAIAERAATPGLLHPCVVLV